MDFYTILTNGGKNGITRAYADSSALELTSFAVGDGGDGYYDPDVEQKELINETYRGPISKIYVDTEYENRLIVECAIPSDSGGYYIREIGIYDANRVLFAVGRLPESYKPIEEEGSTRDFYVKVVLEIHMDTMIASPSAAYRALEGFDPEYFGLIFDPGNMVNEGVEEYQKSFELLGDYIAHIHIKNGVLVPDGEDNLGAAKWKRQWCPLKKGMADLKRLFSVMNKFGYDGTVSIEDFSNEEETKVKLENNLAYMKGMAEAVKKEAEEAKEKAE